MAVFDANDLAAVLSTSQATKVPSSTNAPDIVPTFALIAPHEAREGIPLDDGGSTPPSSGGGAGPVHMVGTMRRRVFGR